MRKRRFLNPTFRKAVRDSAYTHVQLARITGYGIWHSNLSIDLRREDGVADNGVTPPRIEALARVIGFPEDEIWEQ